MDNVLTVEIVTPEKVMYSGKAISVTVNGSKAPFQVLNRHAPIVSTLEIGITKVVDDANNTILFATGSGFTEVHNNKVSILVESAYRADEINVEALTKEIEGIKNKLSQNKNNELLINALKDAENRLKLAKNV